MAVTEGWTLDTFNLNDPANGLALTAVSAPPAGKRPTWLQSPDADGALLLEKARREVKELQFRLEYDPQASMDAALAKIGTLVDVVERCDANASGLSLTWTPANGTKVATFTARLGLVEGVPTDMQGPDAGWFVLAPVVTLRLWCDPFGQLPALANITDDFSTNTIANYTFDAGAAGNVSITGGVMDAAANLTTENRFVHTSSTYSLYDAQVTVKHTLGTTVTSYKAGVVLKRIDASNFLEAYVDDNGVNSRLRIDRVIAGARTNLVTTNLAARVTASTAFWLRGRLEGNVVTAEHWTSAPTVTGTATLSNTTTLAGADATAFGVGVTGRTGLSWIPQQTAATLDDLSVQPAVYRSTLPAVT